MELIVWTLIEKTEDLTSKMNLPTYKNFLLNMIDEFKWGTKGNTDKLKTKIKELIKTLTNPK